MASELVLGTAGNWTRGCLAAAACVAEERAAVAVTCDATMGMSGGTTAGTAAGVREA